MSENQTLNYENVRNTLNIIQKTRESLLFTDESIENALFSFYYASKVLGRIEDTKWAECEINGYQSDDNLPSYRTHVYGAFDFDVQTDLPESLKNETDHTIYISVPRLSYLRKEGEEIIRFAISKQRLTKINQKYGVSLGLDQISFEMRRSSVIQTLGSVKLELINKFEKLENFSQSYLEDHKREAKHNEEETLITYDPKKIFIVHGHDEIARRELYELLDDELHLEPIVLMDKASGGKTVIEKFENHSLNVGFVFVLLTPDDICCLKDDFDKYGKKIDESMKELSIQARQNVILELGYFAGKLGRTRVCCIQKGEKELVPSDLHGLVTIRYRDSVKDKFLDIKKELMSAGYLKS